MLSVSVSYWHVIFTAVVTMMVGALWYSPLVWGKAWQAEVKVSPEEMERAKHEGMTKQYLINFAGQIVLAYVMSMLVGVLAIVTWKEGVILGAWMWLGFVATTLLPSVLWERKSWNYYAINVGYYLVIFCLAGGLLAYFS